MARLYLDQYHTGVFRDELECYAGDNLYEVLRKHGFLPKAVCKGTGVCGGCRVYIAEEGMECLACRYVVEAEELHIILEETLTEHSILLADNETLCSEPENTSEPEKNSELEKNSEAENTYKIPVSAGEDSPLGIAIDIGTTTIASALVDLHSRKILAQTGCLNRQAAFGADVISRIQYAMTENGLKTMHGLLKEDLEALFRYYLMEGFQSSRIKKVCISGNTAMLHFLQKLPVDGLSRYPFTPERLSGSRRFVDGIEVLLLPGKSAFVGADVVAGILHLGLGKTKDYDLLLDLGTNGELWLLNQEGGICTSTACGPAFANSISKGTAHGTTLLDALAQAYQDGKLDETGLLSADYFDTGIFCGAVQITQEAIRQIQLAKSAICTGIELAAYRLRVPLAEISHVYLAGGFGFYLNPATAFCLGLLPKALEGKLQIVGNTSLLGGMDALYLTENDLNLPTALEKSMVLDLSLDKNFQEFFLHRIHFPDR